MSKRKADGALEPGREVKKRSRDAEESLLAQMPLIRRRTKRLLDGPVHKSSFWDARDRKSWHLRYPEMTQLQLDAFMSGAKARREEFVPGKTPLWHLAMKYFPPTLHPAPKGGDDGAASKSAKKPGDGGGGGGEQSLPSPVDESNPSRPEARAGHDMSPPARPPTLQEAQKLADEDWELRRETVEEERKRSGEFRERQMAAREKERESREPSSLPSSRVCFYLSRETRLPPPLIAVLTIREGPPVISDIRHTAIALFLEAATRSPTVPTAVLVSASFMGKHLYGTGMYPTGRHAHMSLHGSYFVLAHILRQYQQLYPLAGASTGIYRLGVWHCGTKTETAHCQGSIGGKYGSWSGLRIRPSIERLPRVSSTLST